MFCTVIWLARWDGIHLSSFTFFQECPSGVVNEETFKEIYSQFFPQGGEYLADVKYYSEQSYVC